MSTEERTLVTAREYPLSLGCLTKAVLSLGLYLFWWFAKKLVVTNRSVTSKSGVLGSNERVIPINRVTDVTVSRGLFGRIFGYGTIRIETAGGAGTEVVASGIQNPTAVRDAILDAQTG